MWHNLSVNWTDRKFRTPSTGYLNVRRLAWRLSIAVYLEIMTITMSQWVTRKAEAR